MADEEITKKTEAYYLPSDVSDWIAVQAIKENRSESNFLTTLIRRLRDSGTWA